MTGHRYRVLDTAGSEVAIVEDERPELTEGEEVELPDGTVGAIVEVYDDEYGRDGGVVATIVVDEA